MNRARPGMVLILVLFALAILAVATAALLSITTREVTAARHGAVALRVRIGAEAAVRSAIAQWDRAHLPALGPPTPIALPAASGTLPGGVRFAASADRIGRALWLIRGEAYADANGRRVAQAAASALVVSIPALEPWPDFAAAVTAPGDLSLAATARVDGTTTLSPPAPWTAAECPAAAAAAVLSLFGAASRPGIAVPAGASVSAPAQTLAGTPPVLAGAPATDSGSFDRFPPLDLSDLATGADLIAQGTLALAPAAVGPNCDTRAPDNWGAPLDPNHPCADHFPLIFAPGDLAVSSGAGQGILIVLGHLRLAPGTAFYGPVLVGASVSMTGAVVEGALRVRDGGHPIDGSIRYSACPLWRAFERAPALRRAWRPPGRWWLPTF